jgi:hypothetical protein
VLGRQLVVAHASSESEIDEAFSTLVQQRAGALMVASDIFLSTRKNQLIALASRHAIPTIYPWRDAVSAGGLIGYGIDLTDSYRQNSARWNSFPRTMRTSLPGCGALETPDLPRIFSPLGRSNSGCESLWATPGCFARGRRRLLPSSQPLRACLQRSN